MAEDLTDYLLELGMRVRYLHSEVDTVQRIEILRDLRLGEFDVLVGINLLREGLDLPEVSLVAILDADKEGFLRSETSLIQTIGPRGAQRRRARSSCTPTRSPTPCSAPSPRPSAGGRSRWSTTGARHRPPDHPQEGLRHPPVAGSGAEAGHHAAQGGAASAPDHPEHARARSWNA